MILVGGLAAFEEKIMRIHTKEVCVPPCPWHAPSGHHMVTWPLLYRFDRNLTERTCRHGVGHPDPDDIRLRLGEDSGIHGCDGCCWVLKES